MVIYWVSHFLKLLLKASKNVMPKNSLFKGWQKCHTLVLIGLRKASPEGISLWLEMASSGCELNLTDVCIALVKGSVCAPKFLRRQTKFENLLMFRASA